MGERENCSIGVYLSSNQLMMIIDHLFEHTHTHTMNNFDSISSNFVVVVVVAHLPQTLPICLLVDIGHTLDSFSWLSKKIKWSNCLQFSFMSKRRNKRRKA